MAMRGFQEPGYVDALRVYVASISEVAPLRFMPRLQTLAFEHDGGVEEAEEEFEKVLEQSNPRCQG